MRRRALIGLCLAVGLGWVEARAASDWDLYMLRLVNRARGDPAGEAGRIGSTVYDSSPAAPPLAYDLLLEQAATSHNNWMHDNLGGIASDWAPLPDSFTHYETLDGSPGGTPATGTPSYTGVYPWDRMEAAGYVWGAAAENILYAAANYPIPINAALIEGNHLAWWESSGHRQNMLKPAMTAFGHHAATRAIAAGAGGLPAVYDTLHYATQEFSSPWLGDRTYILGLLYADRDGSGGWGPRADGDPLREGLAGIGFRVVPAGGGVPVATGATTASGGFSANVGVGTYDVIFTDAALPYGVVKVSGVTVAGVNVDVGDIKVGYIPGDADLNGYVDLPDLIILARNWNRDPATWTEGNFDGDTVVALPDLVILARHWHHGTPPGTDPVPEPAVIVLLAAGAAGTVRRRPASARSRKRGSGVVRRAGPVPCVSP